ncbi:hypothetical protein [Parasitella parasitica]|uniref:Fe2OG dioxygenase domain-containing protein n=1 Tax=Parasitella parasitica TaxID=35722 RepID=A0A0B7MUF3_9FUNG|nr:hypothetical protein [Parasitella parasitica]
MLSPSFDLFGDLSAEEQENLDERRKQMIALVKEKILRVSTDPNQRTIAENRLVFKRANLEKHVKPGLHYQLLTKNECQTVLGICRQQAEWTTDRHSAFPTTDIPIRDHNQLSMLEPLIKERLFDELANYYGFKTSDLEFRDIFLVKYSANAQRGLKLHTDGCLISLTLLISDEHDFEGGGTYFRSLDKVIHLKQGDVAYHAARVEHSGVDITKGERYILVGFVDTLDTIAIDNRNNKHKLRN